MENIQSIDNLVLEMRRGVIVLAVLSQCNQEQYGYSLMKSLSEKGLEIDQGTLYPCCGGWKRKACSAQAGAWKMPVHAVII
jgi:hypothetical protein